MKVCGDVPPHEVDWKVSILSDVGPSKLEVIVKAKTAFNAFQKASPALGNPSFAEVRCTLVEPPFVPAPSLDKKPNGKKKRCTKRS